MKNITLIIFISLAAFACKKQELVKSLAGESYVMRIEQPVQNAPLNAYYMDSTVFEFKSGGVVYWTTIDKGNPTPRRYNYDTTYYSYNKNKFTVGGLTELEVKEINGDDFRAKIKLIGASGEIYNAYFFKIK